MRMLWVIALVPTSFTPGTRALSLIPVAQKMALSTDLVRDLQQDEQGIVQVHEALQQLEKADARAAQMVEMRYFGGYSDKEVALALDVTERTVQRDGSIAVTASKLDTALADVAEMKKLFANVSIS